MAVVLIMSWILITGCLSIEEMRDIEDFIKKNNCVINMDENEYDSSFKLIEPDLPNYQVYLTGEEHGVAVNTTLELMFLKYLNRYANVRYCLCEMSYATAELLNRYMETGNETILETVFKDFEGTSAWSRESYKKWVELYKYNSTLADNKKIILIGIDIEHKPKTAFRYLNMLLPGTSPPKDLENIIKELQGYDTEYCNASDYEDFTRRLISDMSKNSKAYKEYLKEDYFKFIMVLENIMDGINAYDTAEDEFLEIRERCIYENFIKIYNKLGDVKFFGQWGIWHVYQKYEGVQPIAARLNTSGSPVKGKVLSIAYVYDNCRYMADGEENYIDKKLNERFSHIKPFLKYAGAKATLFKLKGERSPFEIGSFLMEGKATGATTQYFQYIVVVKNSQSCEPYGGIDEKILE